MRKKTDLRKRKRKRRKRVTESRRDSGTEEWLKERERQERKNEKEWEGGGRNMEGLQELKAGRRDGDQDECGDDKT